jgi:hypothetical protein
MQQIPKSGFHYANKFALITLHAYEEVMGKNGLKAILNLAGLNSIAENYPPDNLEKQFDFADYATIHVALEEMYGPRGGRGLAMRAGRATFNDALISFGALAGVSSSEFKVLPTQEKIHYALPAAAKIFTEATDQLSSVEETDDAYIWTNQRCPICWSRKDADKPVCFIHTGLLQAMLTWFSGGLEYHVNESKCCAVGEAVCEFVIQKTALG